MPFVNNRGVRIHYETVGHGRPLILHHGTFGSGHFLLAMLQDEGCEAAGESRSLRVGGVIDRHGVEPRTRWLNER